MIIELNKLKITSITPEAIFPAVKTEFRKADNNVSRDNNVSCNDRYKKQIVKRKDIPKFEVPHLCKHFARGDCFRGETCRFRHIHMDPSIAKRQEDKPSEKPLPNRNFWCEHCGRKNQHRSADCLSHQAQKRTRFEALQISVEGLNEAETYFNFMIANATTSTSLPENTFILDSVAAWMQRMILPVAGISKIVK